MKFLLTCVTWLALFASGLFAQNSDISDDSQLGSFEFASVTIKQKLHFKGNDDTILQSVMRPHNCYCTITLKEKAPPEGLNIDQSLPKTLEIMPKSGELSTKGTYHLYSVNVDSKIIKSFSLQCTGNYSRVYVAWKDCFDIQNVSFAIKPSKSVEPAAAE